MISAKVTGGLKVHNPKTGKFSLLPKVHKAGNPGRQIISSVECHSSHISKYVDYHLQPKVVKLKSFTKDSTDTVNKISNIKDVVTKEDIFVIMDVRSLYTNIPNEEGIQTVGDTLNSSASRIATRIVTTFLFFILTLNNFVFNGINYLQTKG